MDLLNCPQQCVCLRKRWSEIVTSKYKAQSILQNTTHVWGAQFSSLTGLVLSNQLEVWGGSSINILNTNSTTNQHTKKAHLKKRGTSLLALTKYRMSATEEKWQVRNLGEHGLPSCVSLAWLPAAAQTLQSCSDLHRPSAPRCCPRKVESTTSPGSIPPPAAGSGKLALEKSRARPSSAFIILTKAAREPIRMALGTSEIQKHCSRGEYTERNKNYKKLKKSKACSGTKAQINTHATHGYDYQMKEDSLYLSCVFVLTIRHLQHSVYL